jgi:hypothetical protein
MPNPISTSADQIVEKYRILSDATVIGEYGSNFKLEYQTLNATRCAILEVEACIAEMVLLGDKVGDIHIGFYGEDRIKELELIKAELKSRIV